MTARQQYQGHRGQARVGRDVRHARDTDGPPSKTLEIRPEALLKNREFFLQNARRIIAASTGSISGAPK
jgi:hypothetical protein